MSDHDHTAKFVKGMILVNIYACEFRRAKFWKRVLDRFVEDAEFNMEQHIIFRLATLEAIPEELQPFGIEAMNKLSIENPNHFNRLKIFTDRVVSQLD